MTTGFREVFEYSRRFVTQEDVYNFSPALDPGYPGHVKALLPVVESGVLPTEDDLDFTEAMFYLQIEDEPARAGFSPDEVRFRRFRTFVNALAGAVAARDNGLTCGDPPNYLVISLLDDADALGDSELMRLLFPAFAELHQITAAMWWIPEDTPFFTLGLLILAFRGFAPHADTSALIERLIAEVAKYGGETLEYLWGCTNFDQHHKRWKKFVDLSFPREPQAGPAFLLRDALLPPSSPVP